MQMVQSHFQQSKQIAKVVQLDNDPNANNHLGAVYKFFVGTDSTDCDIKTDGTDKFVGHATLLT